jgi:hypothetical protein
MRILNRFVSIIYQMRYGLALIACAIAVFQIATPIIGAEGFFDEFRIPYDRATHVLLIAMSVPGPMCHAGLILVVAIRIVQNRDLHWSMFPLGIVFAAWTIYWNREVAHDFSHVVYGECSSRFAEVSAQMELVQSLTVTSLWFALKRAHPRPAPSLDASMP